ncbi:nuclear GTPase SLIP-GC-like isoform X1 [Xiphophorus maculatus]|uniref:nuclear GTPase SLIP-GC-like isoform X1 n=2 Tax=Xiphophorus maculatus TaxID=8083 RepID=UPI000C6E7F78|nr:nuclear GTPase SLIP-GC-like isoform X1 [Xiphophorus maculatus]XP_023204884.1 nuclear GTPase SLIP-GC-like isoform X1 [Xiphophorus maculatus]XP_023205455.1 nuclear GTPase SLIP-GC-like isoform X1 [Xiphophorus maculatus]
MDDFVCDTLTKSGLSNLIEAFEDEGIDTESFYLLQDADIDKMIPKMGPRLKFKKLLSQLKAEQTPNESTHHFPPHVLPSTNDMGKRKSDQQLDSNGQQAAKRKCETNSSAETEAKILTNVRNTMGGICAMLQDDSDLNTLLKTKIKNLETETKELVGVFGKTGAGKTSLINAVLEERNLLPSGSVSACTSVMIKVEGNRHNEKYEAEIEFISPEDWEDELGSLHCIIKKGNQEVQDNVDDSDEEYHDAVDKLSALYEEEWREKSCEQLMESKYFKEIPEFFQSRSKNLIFESAKDLSADIVKYTKDSPKNKNYNKIKQWYWPLVKCVTVRVPNHPSLQHVTLVDLPGNGDRNKSRDTMWKGIVGDCSTVWVVTEVNRAAAEQESWDILKNVASQIGNGGECRHIHIVCTKSDDIDDSDVTTKAETQALILKRNAETKERVTKEFNKLDKIKKHFSDECFQVFTVSSREFFRKRDLSPEDTEIPNLQEFLQNLNDCHSETLNYVSGAHGILSLIHGASRRKEDDRIKEVFEALEKNLTLQIESITNEMMKIYNVFEEHLQEGVERSKNSYENILRSTLYPHKRDGRGFHKQLKKAVENRGVHRPKKGREMNININLTSHLADSIDEEFRTTFPNDGKCGPFKGVIYSFSLVTEELKEKYKDVELQLVSLKSEEERLKTSLNKSIRKRKKTVYRSLIKTIEETLQDCYKKAAAFTGTGTLQNMRETIENHVHGSKNTMFENAKRVMMNHLHNLMMDVLKTLEDTMRESIEVSLKTDDTSFPDVSAQLKMVQKLCDELKSC